MGCDAEHVTAEAASDVPHGAAARALPPCDLVMKGGITSGLVYPGVNRALARRYRFAGIGGSSAGAIAAAFAAAMEHARQVGGRDGIAELDAAVADLQQPGRLFGLFQPTKSARPLLPRAPRDCGIARTSVQQHTTNRCGRAPGLPGAAAVSTSGIVLVSPRSTSAPAEAARSSDIASGASIVFCARRTASVRASMPSDIAIRRSDEPRSPPDGADGGITTRHVNRAT